MIQIRVLPRGLRGRIALTFGTGALLIAGVLATSTFLFSRAYLYHQREQTAVRQASLDAVYISDQLDSADADIPAILTASAPPGSGPGSGSILIERGGQWYSSQLGVGPEVIPVGLIRRVQDGHPARITVSRAGLPTVIVGISLPRPKADFYRVVPLRELKETIRILQIVLATGAIVAALGGIALGAWASRRVVQPLNLVAATAAQVAGGLLDTRLPPTNDPDLATIVGSFNAMVDTLRRRIERDSHFAADVAHELRSPLTTLVAAVEVMERRREELPERSRMALDLVSAELGRFEQLMGSLLTLARTEAGLDPDRLHPTALVELISQSLRRAGLPATVLTVTGDPVVEGDKALLERAFFNLIDNAERHGGGITAIRIEQSADDVMVIFDDQGPGVPATERERIFERFATNRVARGSSSGTGLGLALVAESVGAHGGSVWCTDHAAPGARFVVRLPAARPDGD
jgi:signal transduction histidine kinase